MSATLPPRLSRRGFLLASAAALAPAGLRAQTDAGGGVAVPLAEGQPFSFDLLTEVMRARSAAPYVPPVPPAGALAGLTYDDWRHIVFRDAAVRWTEPGILFRLGAFHTGWLFGEPVRLWDVSSGTVAGMPFSTADFDYRGPVAGKVPQGSLPGVAGFRLNFPLNRPDVLDEVVAFLGASYFRALGRGSAYGLSARGLALNTATGSEEEFPRFTDFFLERPAPGAEQTVFTAALEGPSVTGAYRFVLRPGATTEMEVEARLFFRAAVEEVGIAPLTSMFLFDEKNRAAFDDYRPRVHDSNALRLVAPSGDVMWRPLNNPPVLANSIFAGPFARFGLHQRGRDFADYQDAEAHYERRPSLDVEPLGDWGPGAVRLVEIPTDREVHDNIVAFWVPERRGAEAGDEKTFRYRLSWGNLDESGPDDPAIVTSFKAGLAGVSGVENPADARKFVIDFAGATLADLPADAPVQAVVTHSAGTVLSQTLERLEAGGAWRLVIDLAAPGEPVVELSAHLAGFGRRLTETWLYQWVHEG